MMFYQRLALCLVISLLILPIHAETTTPTCNKDEPNNTCATAETTETPPKPAITCEHLTATEQVLALIAQRLALANDVAGYKWRTKTQIEDLTREQVIIERISAEAEQAGLNAEFARRFASAQIDASKQVQTELLNRWQQFPPKTLSAPDLRTITRPKLDKITTDLIAAVVNANPELKTCTSQATQLITTYADSHQLDATSFATAVQPLLEPPK